ncbi:MAG: sodium/proton-translocating pyrophosphatase [Candidatus Lokiarchaeota archaeon]
MIYDLPIINALLKSLSNIASEPVFILCLFIVIPITLIISLIVSITIFRSLNRLEKKTKKMREIHSFIQRGASIYLKDQAKMLLLVLGILLVPVGITGIKYSHNPFFGFFITAIVFLIGSISSLIAGFIGMKAATKANILVAEASMDNPNKGFRIAYNGGMITGILNISMFVFGIWVLLLLTNMNVYLMVGYNFGASVAALLAQVGGGIYTKSADMGADLVGKYEMNIAEDDPRNPAVIADLVGMPSGECFSGSHYFYSWEIQLL